MDRIREQKGDINKIISICLDPFLEVAGIRGGKPVMVFCGSTPLEGIPGNLSCGEMDSRIALFLEEKRRWGPEMINEILTKQSGMSALYDKRVFITDVFQSGDIYDSAKDIFQYKILLSCGSAIALMNGVDGMVFSGKYVDASESLSRWFLSKLIQSMPGKDWLFCYYFRDTLQQIIVDACRSHAFIDFPAGMLQT